MNIDFASLYGVISGEKDFSGAIERSLKNGLIHLDNYVNMLSQIKSN